MIPPSRRAALHGDAGFTLLEVVAAMAVLAVGLLGLMAVQVGSLSTIGLAKERQTAAQLANRVMEQMRALPYGVVSGGMSCPDLSVPEADPNIAAVTSRPDGSCAATFRPTYDSTISETLTTSSSATQVAPLTPHVQPRSATTVAGVAYDVRSYVSAAAGADAGFWLTAVTTWRSSATKGVPLTIAARSRLYSPQGCLATSTHPFSGPCQAFLYGNAGQVGGGLTLTSTRSGAALLDGLDVRSAGLTLSPASNRVQSEQVVSAQSEVGTSGAKIEGSSDSVQAGPAVATSTADTDPGTGLHSSATTASTVVQTPGSAVVRAGGGAELVLAARPGDSASTFSTTAATGSPACADTSGVPAVTGLACSTSTVTPAGTGSARLTVGGRALGIAELAASSGTTRSYSARLAAPAGVRCQTTSGIGCVTAGVARPVGTVSAGVLPALQPDDRLTDARGVDLAATFGAGPSPLVQVTGYSDSADSEAGVGTGGPSVTRAGTLTFWDGSAFRSEPITTASASYTVPEVIGTYGSLVVKSSGAISVPPTTTSVTGAAPCSTACTSRASSGSLVATLVYSISDGATHLGAFTATLDLGSALAQTSYKAAPRA